MTSSLSPNAIGLNDASLLSNYNDLSALESIKYAKDEEARIDSVSRQFESMFVSMMLKSMRDANKAFSEGNPLNSSQQQFYQDMFDSQLAVSLSTSKGIGIAQVIKQQLMERLGNETNESESAGYALNSEAERAAGFSLEDYERKWFPAGKVEALSETLQAVEETIEAMPVERLSGANKVSQALEDAQKINNDSVTPENIRGPEQFIESLYPLAKQVEAETGIDARLMLAQSALETGWGRKQILTEQGAPSYNLFGIKAHRDWNGNQAEIVTTEYRAGVPLKERASFRVYGSFEESFRDYASFLKGHGRYQEALAVKDQPVEFAHALQSSGYATDPLYGSKIERIMDQYFAGLNPANSGRDLSATDGQQ